MQTMNFSVSMCSTNHISPSVLKIIHASACDTNFWPAIVEDNIWLCFWPKKFCKRNQTRAHTHSWADAVQQETFLRCLKQECVFQLMDDTLGCCERTRQRCGWVLVSKFVDAGLFLWVKVSMVSSSGNAFIIILMKDQDDKKHVDSWNCSSVLEEVPMPLHMWLRVSFVSVMSNCHHNVMMLKSKKSTGKHLLMKQVSLFLPPMSNEIVGPKILIHTQQHKCQDWMFMFGAEIDSCNALCSLLQNKLQSLIWHKHDCCSFVLIDFCAVPQIRCTTRNPMLVGLSRGLFLAEWMNICNLHQTACCHIGFELTLK